MRPVGSPAVATQLYGSVPPVATRATEYGCPTVPTGRGEEGEIDRPVIVSGRDFVTVPPCKSTTFTVTVYDPLAVGMPLIIPFWFNAKPGGKVPVALQV